MVNDETNMALTSLWDALHDSQLTGLSSDTLARSITLALDTKHLWKLAGVDPRPFWRLTIYGASKALVSRWTAWPGPVPDLKDMSRPEQTAAVKAYQAKGRTVSVSWEDFETAVTTHGLCILDADFTADDQSVTLRMEGEMFETDSYFEFRVHGEKLECERTDGVATGLTDLIRLGEKYWEDFSSGGQGEG